MMTTIKTFIIAIFLFSFNGLIAQTKISGTVIDEYTSLPLENVKIKVKDLNIGAISDQKGYFTITLNKEFPIILVSTNLGYDNLETLLSAAEDSLLLKMKSNNILKLSTVNVRGFGSEKEKEAALSVETMSLN